MAKNSESHCETVRLERPDSITIIMNSFITFCPPPLFKSCLCHCFMCRVDQELRGGPDYGGCSLASSSKGGAAFLLSMLTRSGEDLRLCAHNGEAKMKQASLAMV